MIALLVVTCAFFGANLSYVMGDDVDTFNYRGTVGNDYGPSDWGKVGCPHHRTCPGWPDDWETYKPYIPYMGARNQCKDCSSTSSAKDCKSHQQSPIHLKRSITEQNECHDRHWMSYKRGSCKFSQIRFSIERHTLKAYQPIDDQGNLQCSKHGSIDYSMGFPYRWLLAHTDITVPSEHMQDGKRYDAEVVLAHFYTKNRRDRLIGKVVVFLEKGNESDHYGFLQKYIGKWKNEERRVRQNCARRKLGQQEFTNNHNAKVEADEFLGTEPQTEASPNYFGLEEYDIETRQIIEEQEADDFLRTWNYMMEHEFTGNETYTFHRELENDRYHPYDWLIKVQTEYYFRYEGSQGVPPCLEGVHWRVMKDPIKVAPNQIKELERLIANRVDPTTCKRDTAGKPRGNGSGAVDVVRPIQTTTKKHDVVFCECVDWKSKQQKDLHWCKLPMKERGVKKLVNKKKGKKN